MGKALLYARRFGAAATCVTWAGQAVDKQARTLAAGFADGVLRVFTRAKDDLVLQVRVRARARARARVRVRVRVRVRAGNSNPNPLLFTLLQVS